MSTIYLDGKNLSIEDILNISQKGYKVNFQKKVWERINNSRRALERLLYENPQRPLYGVNRGCGNLLQVILKRREKEEYDKMWMVYQNEPQNFQRRQSFRKYIESLEDCQEKYIKAHNCGTGKPLPVEIVRAAMVILLNSFAKGYSGIRPETCKLIIDMLNNGVTPWVLEEGSVGASGDLIPLAMVGAVLLGLPEAKAHYNDRLMSASEALTKAGLKPTRLAAGEAMFLTNSTSFITALAIFALRDAKILLKNASVSAALSIEAIRGDISAFSELVTSVKPYKGCREIAREIREMLKGSQRITKVAQEIKFPWQSLDNVGERIQDRYSFRCIPQVHGAVYDAIDKLEETLLIEINSASSNPLLCKDAEGGYTALSCGNFHGQPLSVIIDYVKIALTGLALITDRRIFSLLDAYLSFGLPQNLAIDPEEGDIGLMLTQYATAARTAESQVLSTPSSVTSIPVCANYEDFVSMGMNGVLHLHKIIYNTQVAIAVEFLCALRALQQIETWIKEGKVSKRLGKLGQKTEKVYEYLNSLLPMLKKDRYLRTDLEKVLKVIKFDLLSIVESSIVQRSKRNDSSRGVRKP